MRYEHIELDISTATCDALLALLDQNEAIWEHYPEIAAEFANFRNELRSRLQRRDADPHCPLNLDPLLA